MNTNNFFTIETISLLSTAFFNLVLFMIIIIKNKKTRNIYYFLGFILSIFIWVVTTLFLYVLDGKALLIDVHLIYFGPAFIPMFMILFIKTFPKEKLGYSKLKLSLFLFFPVFFSILSLIPNAIIKNVVVVNEYSRYFIFGKLYWFYFIYICIYFIFVLYLMVEKYLILKGREKNQIEMIFLNLAIGSFVGVITTLIMSTFGNYSLFWVGSFYSGHLVIAIFYGIVRYGLFDIKLIATEFITLTTWILLFVKILFDKTSTDRLVDSIILSLIIISGIMIIKTVTKEIVLREKDDILVDNITVLNQKLEKTNADLKVLDQKKSEFMSLATHQLRAPLTAMKGYSSMILDGTFGKIQNPEIEAAVNKISRSTTDLTMIVEDYLNISRIEQGSMRYNFSVVNVPDLIKDVLEGVMNTADRLGLKITLNYDATIKYNVSVDPGKMKQVFLNIIDNAIKYTPSGNIDIYIKKTEDGKNVIIKIIDTGVGIRVEVLSSLFQKFVRAPDASKINILGTGLGLYVAGEILKAHSAHAWANSEGVGKGSTFYVELSLVN